MLKGPLTPFAAEPQQFVRGILWILPQKESLGGLFRLKGSPGLLGRPLRQNSSS